MPLLSSESRDCIRLKRLWLIRIVGQNVTVEIPLPVRKSVIRAVAWVVAVAVVDVGEY